MSKMVEVKDVYKDFYSSDGERQILKNINFSVDPGEILVLLGPSGCGKSTILNIISKLIEPTAGDVSTNGKIGYMFQKDHLFEWRTIMHNITLGLEIQKKLTPQSLGEIERLLKIYDLWDFRNNFPKQLSGGMRQRVALIRTLAVNPDILLLD
ncbi:MAG: ABC transporter ATP-binding protein, partial [Turicibacter sp.]